MCAECQIYPDTTFLDEIMFVAGECSMTEGPRSTKLPQSWDTGSDQSGVPAFRDSECLFGPLGCGAVCASCSRRKPSDCEPNLDPLETPQLYSRLISCTRTISILPWELKCVVSVSFPACGL